MWLALLWFYCCGLELNPEHLRGTPGGLLSVNNRVKHKRPSCEWFLKLSKKLIFLLTCWWIKYVTFVSWWFNLLESMSNSFVHHRRCYFILCASFPERSMLIIKKKHGQTGCFGESTMFTEITCVNITEQNKWRNIFFTYQIHFYQRGDVRIIKSYQRKICKLSLNSSCDQE